MRQQDPSIGEVTREDLLEGLRVNRSLLWRAESDVEYRDQRIARCRERIRKEEEAILQHVQEAETAPERIVRLKQKIEQQERELQQMGGEKARKTSTPTTARNELIQQLVARIARGDKEAIVQLQKLMQK